MVLNNGKGQLTYGGVPLKLSTPLMDEWVGRFVSPHDVYEFARRSWPGSRLLGMTTPNFLPGNPIRLGVLHWPVGASRWATFHALAGEADLAALRPLCYGTGPALLQSQELILDDGGTHVSARMFLLPPRRLTAEGTEGTYLLTLVDQRYFWWQRNAGVVQVVPGITQWPDLYRQAEAALGVAVAFDPVHPDYLTPYGLSAFDTFYEPLPVLLDAVAYNVGHRVVAGLDGSLRVLGLTSSVATRDGNRELGRLVLAGGTFHFDTVSPPGPDLGVDAAAVLPSFVTVAFRARVGSALTGGWHPVTVALSSLNASLIGNGGTKTFHDTAQAVFGVGQGEPANLPELTALARRIALDYYNHQGGANQDTVYAGIAPLAPEGLHDLEWTYQESMVKTRLLRPAWNYEPEELLHFQAGAAGSSSSGSSQGALGTDCPPGFVQEEVVKDVACDPVNGLVVTYTTLCVPLSGGAR